MAPSLSSPVTAFYSLWFFNPDGLPAQPRSQSPPSSAGNPRRTPAGPRTSIIRAELCAAATINFFNLGFFALFTLYAVRQLHVVPGVLGLVLGAGAFGGLAGAAITKRLSVAVGVGWANVLGCVLFASPLLLVPLAGGPKLLVVTVVFLAEFGSGFGRLSPRGGGTAI
jgi:hypothetical protein